jgi:hypothetical protein
MAENRQKYQKIKKVLDVLLDHNIRCMAKYITSVALLIHFKYGSIILRILDSFSKLIILSINLPFHFY